jgi:hypothetical protein
MKKISAYLLVTLNCVTMTTKLRLTTKKVHDKMTATKNSSDQKLVPSWTAVSISNHPSPVMI